ncbi:hypothetical protein SAMN05421751_11834 [Jhaorihella thermophila]|uniref:Uncharacterized protein n=1 Tax=Jhaorihella thermophila TaxID=488547 RepID=A0A1H5YGY2_9RHOB|nr:hypothetical protein SAMN05421751_11834 [Jhaorihella thermophila]
MHFGRREADGGVLQEVAETGGHGGCGTEGRALLPPVLLPFGPPSRRRNRSTRPLTIAVKRGDPFRQDIEIMSDHGVTPRGCLWLQQCAWRPGATSGATPLPRARGERFTPPLERPTSAADASGTHGIVAPALTKRNIAHHRTGPCHDRVGFDNAIACARTGRVRRAADRGRAPASPRRAAPRATGSAWPWRRRACSRPARPRSPARGTSPRGSPSCPGSRP